MSRRFLLLGVAGYIAPRHLKAIKENDGNLLAAYDPSDSVGIIDSYYPDASFFTEFERFDRHAELLRREENAAELVSICTPNYLHDAHIRFGLRIGARVICEKPLVLNVKNLDALEAAEKEYGAHINTILQLRLHPSIVKIKEKVQANPDKIFNFDLTYITSRGLWYYASWKGQEEKSGGIATNIGIHFFDMLQWIFGDLKQLEVHVRTHDRAAGYFEFNQARVRWFLSINYDTLPPPVKEKGQRTYRSMQIDGEEIEFSEGFTDLHTLSYKGILQGNGFSIKDARPSVAIAEKIRNAETQGLKGEYHPLAKLELTPHPFL